MFEKYKASEEDIKTIEEGIGFVWNPKLDFIFTEKKFIENVTIISYDCSNFYVWENYKSKVKKIPHKLIIPDKYQMGWRCGFILEKMIPVTLVINLPKNNFVISGSLLNPFITSQKLKEKKLNPYTTRESYLATIVHEFGHAYFANHNTRWYSNKKETQSLLQSALNLYLNKKTKIEKINIPNYAERDIILSETFAFCADYSVASIFWPEHKKDIDNSNIVSINNLIEIEKQKDLYKQDSVLHPKTSAHDAASVFGKIFVNKHSTTWPEKILQANYLSV